MTLYLKFPAGVSPPATTLREVANDQDVPFDPQSITVRGGIYVGYADGSTSDLSDSELDDLITGLEDLTGLNIEGASDSPDIS